MTPVLEERERLAGRLLDLGLEPLPSHANFLFVPVDGGAQLAEALLRRGLAVRPVPGGIRITFREEADVDILLTALADLRS